MNVGLIGCGFIGRKHLEAVMDSSDLQLAAVCDVSDEAMKAVVERYQSFFPAARVNAYRKYAELLVDSNVDIVVVSTLSGLHGRIAKEALIQGKHVVVEKPMALSVQEAREMNRLSRMFGGKLAVCHQKRFYPHLQELKRLLSSGGIGQIIHAEMTLRINRDDAYYAQAPWRGSWEMDGGVLMNQAIHNIDLLYWFAGKPRSAAGAIGRLLRPIEAEDTASAVAETEPGGIVQVHATVCAARGHTEERLRLLGSKGTIELTGKQLAEITDWCVPGVELPDWKPADDGYAALYADLVQAVQTNREPLVNGEEGMIALEWILAVYRAAKERRTIDLPLEQFSTMEMMES
ncbi:gfo/Idh/MocA family oxidoreductase [Xylanibacillus composti]|uniref:Oxidoreductase n=1 Tax=Xylanibacillus composti TaxID=1572762 RepID=A0A8J4H4F9_9BACL|nr:Gfo/Idh/MocA family oxidoreductase [Xylanibacillus composti]MDT9723451.1 gfo/Idh/MocA family oxidoreductase [Xylanibacillus composti]GIQ68513.1 oxidoreductase [Xylanibacillus composti]